MPMILQDSLAPLLSSLAALVQATSLIILTLQPRFPPPLLSPPAIRVYTQAKLPKA